MGEISVMVEAGKATAGSAGSWSSKGRSTHRRLTSLRKKNDQGDSFSRAGAAL